MTTDRDRLPEALADLSAPRWSVHRLDDNGNRYVVARNLSRQEADRLVAQFESRGHKQVYWAEVAPPPSPA